MTVRKPTARAWAGRKLVVLLSCHVQACPDRPVVRQRAGSSSGHRPRAMTCCMGNTRWQHQVQVGRHGPRRLVELGRDACGNPHSPTRQESWRAHADAPTPICADMITGMTAPHARKKRCSKVARPNQPSRGEATVDRVIGGVLTRPTPRAVAQEAALARRLRKSLGVMPTVALNCRAKAL